MNRKQDDVGSVTPQEARDVLITAYALGQLEGEDREAAEAILAATDAEAARQQVAEASQVAAALVDARDHDVPERSPELRRAVIAAVAQSGKSSTSVPEPVQRRRHLRWVFVAGGVALSIPLLVVLLLPPVQHAREVARRVVDTEIDASVPQQAAPRVSSVPLGDRKGAGGLGASAPGVDLQPDHGRSVTSGRANEQAGGQSSGLENTGDLHRRIVPSEVYRDQSDWQSLTKTRERFTNKDLRAVDSPVPHGQAQGHEQAREHSGERYNRFSENGFLTTADRPLSTFSIDVDTASYANVRRFLMAGQRPPRDAVRIEEFVNYFSYDDPAPTGEVPFSVNVEAATCPWRPNHKIVRIGLAGRDVNRDQRPAGNLVFLVDVSGSMADADKLPLVKQSLLMLVEELTENDRVAIVTYAGNAGLVLPSTSGDQKQKIREAIEALSSGGSTHGSAGITLAYEQAAERFIQGGANRVILATDGDLNVGITSDEALVELITRMAKGGTFLTVLGFGQGNLQDEKMEKLADKGNGIYAYIDGVREARKVLVEQLTGSTITIAKDVKIQVEFNPARVASYRLVGYENRALADRDFRDDTKDAGEIGAGHHVTALYEITLVGEGEVDGTGGAEPFKYQPNVKADSGKPIAVTRSQDLASDISHELLTVKLRYKQPDGDKSRLLEVPLADAGGRFDDASANLRFASAVAAFGMILRGSEHAGGATLPMVAEIAGGSLGADDGGYRAEFLDLVRRAEQAR